MWNVIVFAVLGLVTGDASRVFFPGRRFVRILGTMIVGMIGAVSGGLLSWIWWPLTDGEFQSGNLLLSILGAALAIAIAAGVAYQRSLASPTKLSG